MVVVAKERRRVTFPLSHILGIGCPVCTVVLDVTVWNNSVHESWVVVIGERS